MRTQWKSCVFGSALAALFVVSQPASASLSLVIRPSLAPNAFSSSYFNAWATASVSALESGTGDVLTALPDSYRNCKKIKAVDNLVSSFPSWYGVANPGGSFAGEYGQRLHFGVRILGNGTQFRLSNLTFEMHSSDPGDTLGWVDGFGPSDVYSFRRKGIDYVDGIKGNGNDIVYQSGEPATNPVDELIYAGAGNAFWYPSAPGGTDQEKLNYGINQVQNLGSMLVTMTYTMTDELSNVSSATSTVYVEGDGLPVDLNGRYISPSQLGVTPGTSFASTSTNANRVAETSAAALAPDSTFTPFSDATKPPKSVALDMRGKSYEFDVDLHDRALWADVIGITPQEFFVLGLGSGAGNPGDERAWVICWKGPADVNGNTFKVELQTDLGVSAGVWYDAYLDETKFHVRASINPANSQMTAIVTPLDGLHSGISHDIGPLALAPVGDDVSNAYFYAGFYSTALKSTAKATLTSLMTTGGSNALFLFADDPYVKLAEPIGYRLGMANLNAPVYGFQGFIQSNNGNQVFGSGSYTVMPFSLPLTAITGAGNLSSGVDFGFSPVHEGADLANLDFSTNSMENATGLSFRPDSGSPAFVPNQFVGDSGAVLASVLNSNLVVVDSTAPALSGLSALQGATNVLNGANPTIQGGLTVSVNALDVAPGSGLAGNPTISIDFPAGADVVNAPMYAGPGNTFRFDYSVTPANTAGVATITINAVDDAGNSAVPATGTLNLNTAQLSLTIVLDSSDNNLAGSITRGMVIKIGSDPAAGSNAAFYANKNVVFSDSDGAGPQFLSGTATITALDGLPWGKHPNAASVKDPKHTLRKLASLTEGANSQFSGIAVLKGGDANNDNLIDILDFGVYASQYGSTPGANTLLGFVGNHAEFSGNGSITTADFTFIAAGFLSIGDGEPGNFSDGGGDQPLSTCTIRQMMKAGVSEKLARALDADGDGWITVQEIQKWLNSGRR